MVMNQMIRDMSTAVQYGGMLCVGLCFLHGFFDVLGERLGYIGPARKLSFVKGGGAGSQ